MIGSGGGVGVGVGVGVGAGGMFHTDWVPFNKNEDEYKYKYEYDNNHDKNTNIDPMSEEEGNGLGGVRWSPEEARHWMASNSNPFLNLGIDKFVPSSAANSIQMWQEHSMNWKLIQKELIYAKQLWGISAIRVYLHPILLSSQFGTSTTRNHHDHSTLQERIQSFLQICDKLKIKVVLVLLDSTMNPYPLGCQNTTLFQSPEPIPGIYNSRWVQSPGRPVLENAAEFERVVKPYIQTIIAQFGRDPRLLGIDLWNDPFQTNDYTYGSLGHRVASTQPYKNTEIPAEDKTAMVQPLLTKVWQWARDAGPASVPLLMNMGGNGATAADLGFRSMIENADVLLLPTWYDDTKTKRSPMDVQMVRDGTSRRPVMMMHGLARDEGIDLISTLQQYQQYYVFVDGLVEGKTQLKYPVSTWNQDVLANSWHSDLMYPNGTAYSYTEARYVRDWLTTQLIPGVPAEALSSSSALPNEALTDTEETVLFLIIPLCVVCFMFMLLCFWEIGYRRKRQRIKHRKMISLKAIKLKTDGPVSPFLTVCLGSAVQEQGTLDRQLLLKAIKSQFPTLASAIPFEPTTKKTTVEEKDDTEVIDIQDEAATAPLPVIGCAAMGKDSISHNVIHRLVTEMGEFLHKSGVGCGDRVALVLPPHSPEMATCSMAIANWASCVVIPSNQSFDEIQQDLIHSQAKMVIGLEKDEALEQEKEVPKVGFISPFARKPEEKESDKKKSSSGTDSDSSTDKKKQPEQDLDLDLEQLTKDLTLPFASMTISMFECGEYTLEWKTDDVEGKLLMGKSEKKFFENEFKDEVLVFLTEDPETKEKKMQTCTLGELLMASVTVSFLWNLSAKDVAFSLMPMTRLESILHQVFVPVLSGGGTIIGEPRYFWPFMEELGEKRSTWYYADHTTQEQILETSLEHDIHGVSLRLIAIPAHDFLPFEARELNSMFGAQVVLAYGMDFYKKGNVRGSSPEQKETAKRE